MESAENQAQSISDNELGSVSEPSLSRTETLKLLNDSIDQLEQTIRGIKDNSTSIPPRDSVNTLVSTTQKLADAVVPTPPTPITDSGSITNKSAINQKVAPFPQENSSPIKSEQPKITKVEQKIETKRNLTWIIIGVTAVAISIVAIFWLWLPQQQTASVTEPAISEVLSNPTEIDRQPIAEPPLITPEITAKNTTSNNLTAESELVDSDLEDSVATPGEILIPPVLESPGRTKNLKMETIEPQLNFTAEQALIASLETKVANLLQDYPKDLIASVQVDIPQNNLLVKVTDNWYELSESRQNKLGNEMLSSSRDFDFAKLELKDHVGTLVARNPVIGDRIVLLQNDLPLNRDSQE